MSTTTPSGTALGAEADSAGVDAFTAEVIRSALVSITDEMKTNLMRTAYNMIIYEAEDFTTGVFDADGNTLSIGLGLPMFIRGVSETSIPKGCKYRSSKSTRGANRTTN